MLKAKLRRRANTPGLMRMRERSSPRAVQRCRFAVTESALPHLMVEMRRLITRGISELAIV